MLNNLCATNYASLIMLGFLVVIFVVMLVVSSKQKKKQQKEIQEKLDSLKVGDRVKTIGLVCGIVVDVNPEENTFVLETGKGNHGSFIKFDKSAIYQISSKKKEDKKTEAEPVETTEIAKDEEVKEETVENKD